MRDLSRRNSGLWRQLAILAGMAVGSGLLLGLYGQSVPAPAVADLSPSGAVTRVIVPAPQSGTASLPAAQTSAPPPLAAPPSNPVAGTPMRPRLERRRPAQGLVLPAGTPIPFRLEMPLSTQDDRAGGSFAGRVTRDIYLNRRLVIPEGSILEGRILRVHDQSPLHGRSEMMLNPDFLRLPGGQTYVLSAEIMPGQNLHGAQVGAEGAITGRRGPTHADKHHAIESGGAGLVTGALLAGGEGALIGTGVGAAAVGGWYLFHTRHLNLPAGTRLVIRLDRGVQLK